MSTTYRFVPMSEVKLETLENEKTYFIIEHEKEKIVYWNKRLQRFESRYNFHPEPICVLLPVEPFSPLSEEEIERLAECILREDGCGNPSKSSIEKVGWGIKKAISLMEGEAETFAEWVEDENYFRYFGNDESNCKKWYKQCAVRKYYTISELLAIFREEQKRKKERV